LFGGYVAGDAVRAFAYGRGGGRAGVVGRKVWEEGGIWVWERE